jgi:uncharacterized repeat protein (TIGR03803 family)
MKVSSLVVRAVAFAAAAIFATSAMAQSESVIKSFPSGTNLFARLFHDKSGNLYGTTYEGNGTIFELVERRGVWKESTIWDFSGSQDGHNPAAGLIEDKNGVLYGTTRYGGTSNEGTVFSLAQGAGRSSTETVLYNFTGGSDGGEPDAGLVMDTATGTIYGTAEFGGNANCGSVFALTPSGGTWTESTLYDFKGGTDGCAPQSEVHQGSQPGTLLGITTTGGTSYYGAVFLLTETGGNWSETILHTFTGGSDGGYPIDTAIDNNGNLYGVTLNGGLYGAGVVFEISKVNHTYQETVLYNFTGGDDGSRPVGVHYDTITNILYGTTVWGGSNSSGTVFELVNKGSSWTESVRHSFGSAVNDGIAPQSRPVEDPQTGTLYGTTTEGGRYGAGTAYVVTP